MFLIGQDELFTTGHCAQIPKAVWAIVFGHLTLSTGWTEEEFMGHLVCYSASAPAYSSVCAWVCTVLRGQAGWD